MFNIHMKKKLVLYEPWPRASQQYIRQKRESYLFLWLQALFIEQHFHISDLANMWIPHSTYPHYNICWAWSVTNPNWRNCFKIMVVCPPVGIFLNVESFVKQEQRKCVWTSCFKKWCLLTDSCIATTLKFFATAHLLPEPNGKTELRLSIPLCCAWVYNSSLPCLLLCLCDRRHIQD